MHPATFFVLSLVMPFISLPVTEGSKIVQAMHAAEIHSASTLEETIQSAETSIAVLTRSLTRSGCHADIAATLRQSCQSNDENRINAVSELHKRGVAISFTICSIQSASQQVPKECSPWDPSLIRQDSFRGSDGAFRPEEQSVESLQSKQTICLGPQEWSAYNVYLSDSTQLCHALEARKEAELAHTRYVNATMEKISLLRLLKERESAQLSRESQLNDVLGAQSSGLKSATEFVLHAQRKLREDMDLSSELQRDLRTSLSMMEGERTSMWERIEKDIKDRLFDADVRFENMVFDLKDTWAAELSSSLIGTLQKHDVVLDNHFQQADTAVKLWLSDALHQFQCVAAYTNEQIALLHDSWADLDRWIHLANDEIATFDRGLYQLHSILASSMETSQNLSLAQGEVTRSLGLAIAHTDTLLDKQNYLENSLNRSIDLAERNLRIVTRWKASPALALFSGPAAISLSSFQGFGTTVLIWSLQLIWQMTYSMVSALCCVFILFRTGLTRSISRWFSRIGQSSADEESRIATQNNEYLLADIQNRMSPIRKTPPFPPPKTHQLNVSGNQHRLKRAIRRSASAPL